MLRDFLADNRKDVLERWRARVVRRSMHGATIRQLQNGVPTFFDQLITRLDAEKAVKPVANGPAPGKVSASSEIGKSAGQHGRALLKHNYSIEDVVHDYGDLFQTIMDLAYEREASFPVGELRILNHCIDDAIADAVTEFNYQHDVDVKERQAFELHERLEILANELRDLLGTATLAFAATRSGSLNLSGRTGSVLEGCLVKLRNTLDTTMTEARLQVENSPQYKVFSLVDFIDDARQASHLEAQSGGHIIEAAAINGDIFISADRDLLLSAIGNLLRNIFAFYNTETKIHLNAYAVSDGVRIEIESNSISLAPDNAKKFPQFDDDTSEFGRRHSIVRRAVESNGGRLTVQDVSSSGHVTIITLPRYEWDSSVRAS